MKFTDIRQFPHANYIVNVSWKYMEEQWITKQRGINCKPVLDPDYQRGYVWTDQQKTKYVEYILMGGFSGKDIFWNCSSWMNNFDTPLELVDGKQRISAALDFMKGKIKVFNLFIDEYEDELPFSTYFIFNVNNLKTRLDVLQWYLDLNSGGTIHTEKDLSKVRKMIYQEKIKTKLNKG